MREVLDLSGKFVLGSALALAVLVPPGNAHAQTFTAPHAIQGSDGANPLAVVIADKKGNGTVNGSNTGARTVFEPAPDGKLKMLHSSRAQATGSILPPYCMGKRPAASTAQHPSAVPAANSVAARSSKLGRTESKPCVMPSPVEAAATLLTPAW